MLLALQSESLLLLYHHEHLRDKGQQRARPCLVAVRSRDGKRRVEIAEKGIKDGEENHSTGLLLCSEEGTRDTCALLHFGTEQVPAAEQKPRCSQKATPLFSSTTNSHKVTLQGQSRLPPHLSLICLPHPFLSQTKDNTLLSLQVTDFS